MKKSSVDMVIKKFVHCGHGYEEVHCGHGYEEVHCGHGYGETHLEGVILLERVTPPKACVNTAFEKMDENLMTCKQ